MSCDSRIALLMMLLTTLPSCRPSSDDNSDESGSIRSNVEDLALSEPHDLEEESHWGPVISETQIATSHPEDPKALAELKSLGCWLSKTKNVHTFLGYPTSHDEGKISDDDFHLMNKLPNLRELQISRKPFKPLGFSAEAFRHIHHHPELRKIALSGGLSREHFQDTLFVYLAKMPKLISLSIRGYHLKGNSLEHLGQIQNLKTLSLAGSRFEETDWLSLGQLKNLESLDLSLCEVGDEDLKFLTSLKNLRQLELYGNGKVTRNSLPMLQQLPKLEALTLTHTGIYPVTLDDIAAFPALRQLHVLDVQPEFTRSELKAQFPNLDYGEDD